MSKRYYIAPVVGEGTEESPYRAKVPAGVNYVAEIDIHPAGHPQEGRPAKPWALVMVATADHTALLEDPDLDALPDVGLETTIANIPTAARANMRERFTARGINGRIAQDADTMRDVIRSAGRNLNPTFHEDNFNVSE